MSKRKNVRGMSRGGMGFGGRGANNPMAMMMQLMRGMTRGMSRGGRGRGGPPGGFRGRGGRGGADQPAQQQPEQK